MPNSRTARDMKRSAIVMAGVSASLLASSAVLWWRALRRTRDARAAVGGCCCCCSTSSGGGGNSDEPRPMPISKKESDARPLNSIEAQLAPELLQMHDDAVANGDETYIDPATGFTVFTRVAHLRRGRCCGSYCRHCPYGHVNVRFAKVNADSSSSDGEPDRESAPLSTAAAARPTSSSVQASEVYTKGGDKGTSALFTGERRKKTDVVFEALGAVDELSSHVGVVRALLREMAGEKEEEEDDEAQQLMGTLEDIQQQLLNIGTVVATPAADEKNADVPLVKLLNTYRFADKTAEVEKLIDVMDSRLEPQRLFILPGGGNSASAQLHVCRTVCRRAERRMIDVRDCYGEQYTDHLREATVYVNRLSDFFFVASRSVAEEDIVRMYE